MDNFYPLDSALSKLRTTGMMQVDKFYPLDKTYPLYEQPGPEHLAHVPEVKVAKLSQLLFSILQLCFLPKPNCGAVLSHEFINANLGQ